MQIKNSKKPLNSGHLHLMEFQCIMKKKLTLVAGSTQIVIVTDQSFVS
jgi:hypothetical protein